MPVIRVDEDVARRIAQVKMQLVLATGRYVSTSKTILLINRLKELGS